jgi:hypothetical protein
MFVADGDRFIRFEHAIESGDVDGACALASELQYVGILDALKLCRAMAKAGDGRYERAAARWLFRIRAEAGASLDELQLATAALGVMGRSPDSEDAWATLTSIVRAKG